MLSAAAVLFGLCSPPPLHQESLPDRTSRPALVYDDARDCVVLFGGGFGKDMQGRTWEFASDVWKEISAVGPSPRNSHGMVYDRARRRVVLFGGNGAQGLLGDTWEYDGRTWKLVATQGPPARSAFGMAYDSRRKKTVLFGGAQDAGQPSFNDTWEWDGKVWARIPTAQHPPGISFQKLAFDEERGMSICFGGRWGKSETWGFDGAWKLLATEGPPGRDHHAMTYDSRRKSIVVFGGVANLPEGGNPTGSGLRGDTWEWNGKKWTEVSADGPTDYGGLPGFAYASKTGTYYLFGASTNSQSPGFWKWDRITWTPIGL